MILQNRKRKTKTGKNIAILLLLFTVHCTVTYSTQYSTLPAVAVLQAQESREIKIRLYSIPGGTGTGRFGTSTFCTGTYVHTNNRV